MATTKTGRFPLSGTGSPLSVVIPDYIGQIYTDIGSGISYQATTAVSTGWKLIPIADGSNYNLQFYENGGLGSDPLLTWDDTNKWLGVGIATPTSNFQVAQGTSGPGVVSISGTAVTGSATQFTNTFKVGDSITATTSSGLETKLITAVTSDTVLATESFSGTATSVSYTLVGGSRFVVRGNGNVGINTTTPATLLSIKGTTKTDTPTYGTEFLSDSGWTSTGWTGSWATGWIHTVGNTSVLSYPTAAVNAVKYQISFTVTGRTAGSFTISFGGQTYYGRVLTGTWGPTTSSTSNLTITPTSNFDGTIVISIKQLTTISTPISTLFNSSGNAVSETRTGSDSTNNNVFIGVNSGGYLTTGYGNIAFGMDSLLNTTTAFYNTAIGNSALKENTTGHYNTSIGNMALYFNLVGTANTAIGRQSAYGTTSSLNSAIGYLSLLGNTTGYANTALGAYGLSSNTIGSLNSVLGIYAGLYQADGVTALTDPENSIYIGYNAKGYSNLDTNSIVIGHEAIGKGADTIVLGNDSITNTTLKGDVGITTVELAAESLTNPSLTGGTSWAATNDCALIDNKAMWTFETGLTSNLTQTQANMAIPGVGSKWYRFDYTVSGVIMGASAWLPPTATITTSFAKTAVPLTVLNGARTVYFQSATTPTDFVIVGVTLGTRPTFSITNLSLKQVTTDGQLRTPNSKAALDIYSTTKGVLSPRMTTVQRDAITSVPEGLSIYNTTTHQPEFYYGSWMNVADNSITNSKIAYNAVDTNQIADNAVTTSKMVAPGDTGQVIFNDADVFTADALLHWDNTNKFLGVGFPAPGSALHVYGWDNSGGPLDTQLNNILLDGIVDGDKAVVFADNNVPKWSWYTYRNEEMQFMYYHNLVSDRDNYTVSEDGRIGFNKLPNSMEPASYFVGSGLDDMTVGGIFTGEFPLYYEIVIDHTGSPDSFKWRTSWDNVTWSSWTENVSITGSAQTLSYGVTVVFAATTGHALSDEWKFTGFSQLPYGLFTVQPQPFDKVWYYNGSTWVDNTYNASSSNGQAILLHGDTDDYTYFGKMCEFNSISLFFATLGAGCTLKLEYYNGASWETLTVSNNLRDTTLNCTQNGALSWDKGTIPTWTPVSVNASTAMYFIRMSSTTEPTTDPYYYVVSPNTNFRFSVYTGAFDYNNPAFCIDGTGSVGIGITRPIAQLHIYGDDTTDIPDQANGLMLDGVVDSDISLVYAVDGALKWSDYLWRSEDGKYKYLYNYASQKDVVVQTSDGRWGINKINNVLLPNSDFSSSVALNDMTVSGTFTGELPLWFQIMIDSTGTPDTFKWRTSTNGTTWTAYTENVAITGAAQLLTKGVSVTFAATTGHTLSTYWSFTAFAQLPFSLMTIAPQPFDWSWYTSNNGSSYIDYTYRTMTTTGISVPFVGSSTNLKNYFGKNDKFNSLYVYFKIHTEPGQAILELSYWNGSEWHVLTAGDNNYVDGTSGCIQDGAITWDLTSVSDWVPYAVNGKTYYWMRVRSTRTPTPTPHYYIVTPSTQWREAIMGGYADTDPCFAVHGNGTVSIGTGTVPSKTWPRLFLQETIVDAYADYNRGIYSLVYANSSATSSAQIWGYQGIVQVKSGTTVNYTNTGGALIGVEGKVDHSGTGTVASMYGGEYRASNSNNGVVTEAVSLYVVPPYNGSSGKTGSITTGYGIKMQANAVTYGNVVTQYALAIDAGLGNVGIGTLTPDSHAILDVTSTTQGFLPPRLTTTQRDAIVTPTEGLGIYNNTNHRNEVYNGTSWVNESAPGGTDGYVQFNNNGEFGAASLFWDVGTSRYGVGTITPQSTLDIGGITAGLNGGPLGVYSSGSPTYVVVDADSGKDAYIVFNMRSDQYAEMGVTTTGPYILSNTEGGTFTIQMQENAAVYTRITVNAAGDMGIGIDAPLYKLDVDGEINVNEHQIHNVSTPLVGLDAANKDYVDNIAQGLIWQEAVIDILNIPPTPDVGARYIVGTSPSGEWVGHANDIATYSGASIGDDWTYETPSIGWICSVTDLATYYRFNNTSWLEFSIYMQHNILQGIQGGSLNEYYHFNHSDYDSLQNLITYAVVSNTEYFNPSFIASLAGSKITGTLADNLVATASIQANAVDATKIADNAIITRHILNSNVTTDKIADNGITTAKIAYNAVTQDQIAYNAVGTNQIATNAISSNAVVNASGVAGSYVTDALNNLNGSFTNLVTKTTTYAASTTDYIIVGDTTSVGPFTITLPTAVGMSGKSYIIKRMGTGTLSIATTSSQTIDGDAAPYDITMDRTSVTIVSNGSNWILV